MTIFTPQQVLGLNLIQWIKCNTSLYSRSVSVAFHLIWFLYSRHTSQTAEKCSQIVKCPCVRKHTILTTWPFCWEIVKVLKISLQSIPPHLKAKTILTLGNRWWQIFKELEVWPWFKTPSMGRNKNCRGPVPCHHMWRDTRWPIEQTSPNGLFCLHISPKTTEGSYASEIPMTFMLQLLFIIKRELICNSLKHMVILFMFF